MGSDVALVLKSALEAGCTGRACTVCRWASQGRKLWWEVPMAKFIKPTLLLMEHHELWQ